MRWSTFLILLYFMTALQAANLGGMPNERWTYWPVIEFVPVLAVFYALYAAETAAPLAALLCGVAYDLTHLEFIGTNAVPLALTAWLIVRIRLSVFREHFLAQLMITLLAILVFAILEVIFRAIIRAPLQLPSYWGLMGYLAGNALYSAIVAPVIYGGLFRIQGLLGFTSHGARSRGR